jgi:hypothetical protein
MVKLKRTIFERDNGTLTVLAEPIWDRDQNHRPLPHHPVSRAPTHRGTHDADAAPVAPGHQDHREE